MTRKTRNVSLLSFVSQERHKCAKVKYLSDKGYYCSLLVLVCVPLSMLSFWQHKINVFCIISNSYFYRITADIDDQVLFWINAMLFFALVHGNQIPVVQISLGYRHFFHKNSQENVCNLTLKH